MPRNRTTPRAAGEQYKTKAKQAAFQTVSVDDRLATTGQLRSPQLPVDSSLLPWDEIFSLRGCPNPDGV